MRALPVLLFGVTALLPGGVAAQSAPFAIETVTENIDAPVFVTAPAGDPRLFVIDQGSGVRIIADGKVLETPFLDLTDVISSGGERGVLGLAFHPDYASNGRFFVDYTDTDGNTHVVGYTVSGDANVADPATAQDLFTVEQPYANHNGGWLGFGPDGLLYVAMGDGGDAGDPQRNGQNMESRLGKILRINVDGGEPEIFVSGVRNPWRNAWDGDLLYIADVGQDRTEEIDVVAVGDAGANLGWSTMEGDDCFRVRDCDETGLTLPIFTYSHGESCSITGGSVYRGSAIPELVGRYLFSDYCSGILQSLVYENGAAADAVTYTDIGTVGNVTSFGTDSNGEIYITIEQGKVLKLVPNR